MAVSSEIKAAVEAAHGTASARELAERYGLTRNQVIGIWYRRPRAEVGEQAVAPVEEPRMPTGLTGAAAAVAAIRRACCRWPIGEPGSEAFRFCSEQVVDEGKPYCPDHRLVASGGRWSARSAA